MSETTDETPAADGRRVIAEELALLTMLADRVTAEKDKRRAMIADGWADGDSVTIEMPNADNPARPTKVGTVRADGGQGVARVSDRPAWIKWCEENVPHNVVRQAEDVTKWALDEPSRVAISFAAEAYLQVGRGFGRRDAATETFLEVLEAQGYTLTRAQRIPAETIVRPAWETETLKLTQKDGTPVCPGGGIPDGIEFVEPDKKVKPVVTIGKDETMRERFVAEQRHRLLEITGAVIGEDKEL